MSHERFLADIASHPSEDAPKLVYADWLEERGDTQADFIRLVVEGVDGRQATVEELATTLEMKWSEREREQSVRDACASMSPRLWPLLAADFAEKAVCELEGCCSKTDPAGKAIQAVRDGESQEVLEAAAAKAMEAAEQAWGGPTPPEDDRAILGTIGALSGPIAAKAARCKSTIDVADVAAHAAVFSGKDGLRWQLIRLAEYKLWGKPIGLWSGE
ncbi:MAG: TIGR02996 domain-containing protein [Planctomycetales bacterium]